MGSWDFYRLIFGWSDLYIVLWCFMVMIMFFNVFVGRLKWLDLVLFVEFSNDFVWLLSL